MKKEILHEAINLGVHGDRGRVVVMVDAGDPKVALLMSDGGAGLGVQLLGRLTVPEVEAFIALLQLGVDTVNADQARAANLPLPLGEAPSS